MDNSFSSLPAHKKLIIPRGVIDSSQNTVIQIPKQLSSTQNTLVVAQSRRGLVAREMPEFGDELSEHQSNFQHLTATSTSCSADEESPRESRRSRGERSKRSSSRKQDTTRDKGPTSSKATTSSSHMNDPGYSSGDSRSPSPKLIHASSKSTRQVDNQPAESMSMRIDAPGGVDFSALRRLGGSPSPDDGCAAPCPDQTYPTPSRRGANIQSAVNATFSDSPRNVSPLRSPAYFKQSGNISAQSPLIPSRPNTQAGPSDLWQPEASTFSQCLASPGLSDSSNISGNFQHQFPISPYSSLGSSVFESFDSTSYASPYPLISSPPATGMSTGHVCKIQQCFSPCSPQNVSYSQHTPSRINGTGNLSSFASSRSAPSAPVTSGKDGSYGAVSGVGTLPNSSSGPSAPGASVTNRNADLPNTNDSDISYFGSYEDSNVEDSSEPNFFINNEYNVIKKFEETPPSMGVAFDKNWRGCMGGFQPPFISTPNASFGEWDKSELPEGSAYYDSYYAPSDIGSKEWETPPDLGLPKPDWCFEKTDYIDPFEIERERLLLEEPEDEKQPEEHCSCPPANESKTSPKSSSRRTR